MWGVPNSWKSFNHSYLYLPTLYIADVAPPITAVTIIDIQAKFGYSLGDSDYSSVKIGFGRFEYVSDNDETPITGSKSYAYTGEDDEALPEDGVLL